MNPEEPIIFTNLLEEPPPEEPEPELIDDPLQDPEPLLGELPLDIEP